MCSTLIYKCESLGSGKQSIIHGNPSTIAKDFSQHLIVLRCHLLPNMSLHCCTLLQGTLSGNFDIFAASDDSTAWVLFWKTSSTPIGVSVCLGAQFNFLRTAFDPREWTMVVFWKESSGYQPQVITPKNEGRDETNYPSPPPNFTFFDDPDVLSWTLWTSAPLAPPGPPPGWPPAPSPAVGEKR